MSEPEVVQRRVEVNGLDYAYLEAGEGPLAICIHGFPDTAFGWVSLMGALAGAGYHAVAPFMRGYAPTAVPADSYAPLGAWVADIDALHALLGGGDDAVLVGHDWGALTTYGAAGHSPDKWRRIVTMSIPPSAVMATRMFDYDQVKMFWYQYVFLQPTAEMIVANDDLEFISRIWGDWSPGYDATEALVSVKAALRDPANLTAALSTYRTVYDFSQTTPELMPFQLAPLSPNATPTLYLHGEHDGCVAADVVEPARAVLPAGSRAEVIHDAGHFIQYERPATVNGLVLEFLAAP